MMEEELLFLGYLGSNHRMTLTLINEGYIRCRLAYVCNSLQFQDQFLVDTHDLITFANELEAMHDRLAGSASLMVEYGRLRLDVSIAQPQRGRLTIAGVVTNHDAPTEFRFDGLSSDQSYLPEIVQRIRRVMNGD